MASTERWYFDLEHIHSTPSIKCGYDHDKELSCRQQAANFIQDMGQRLQVNQLCINTAIVYMHRFYMFHSFHRFHRTSLASAALFLAAKVEEQPRKLEHVIRFSQICLHREQIPFDVNSQSYMEQVQDLIMNENILLQTLGFDVAIDHPHTHIVRCCQLVRASKDLAQTSYFMASYSLHLTTMCLQYKPTVVACFCIHLACKWSNWEIPESSEGKSWFWYVDKSVTSELLENLTAEFLNLFEKCPSRLKKKIMALSTYSNLPPGISNPQGLPAPQMTTSQQDLEKKKENRLIIESHNPLTAVPHPIGPLGVAVAEATALNMACVNPTPHNLLHQQNPMSNRHGGSEPITKKQHYERSAVGGPAVANILPPASLAAEPYKKLHHLAHHQRESPMAIAASSSSNKSSCMFDNCLVQPPPPQPSSHKAYQHGHINPAVVHPTVANSRGSNHLSQSHRTSSSRPPHIRNGEAHFPEKKFSSDIKREQLDTKPPQMLAPPAQVPPRMKPKTPPTQLNLMSPIAAPPIKIERSIFSPEEKAVSPPQTRVQEKIKISPPPTPRTPVEIKKESPHSDVELAAVASSVLLPPDTRPREPASLNSGDNGRERIADDSLAPPAPDTPSKSSHMKKKKKKHKDHKDKHKDKHKHKHRLKDPEPIVITIPKDKITISQPEGLKIKIAKEKISNPPSGLKLKISKDKLKESKKRDRSDCEEEELEQPSKQHRPNGTTALQVTQSTNFSSLLGKSILSPIRTPGFSNKYDSSPASSPVHIPKYSPTKAGYSLSCVRTPGYCLSSETRYSPSQTKRCLSPIAATPVYSCTTSPEPNPYSSPDGACVTLASDANISPVQSKPFLSPIAATPRHYFKSPKNIPTRSELVKITPVTELPNMSPMNSKPFLSPIAATPRHVPKTKSFKSPVRTRNTLAQSKYSDIPHMSPIRSKPFLSPLGATPMHSAKAKTFKSPGASHVYVPIARLQPRVSHLDLTNMSPVDDKPFLSPIAPTPRYPSPKQKASPPSQHRYVPMMNIDESCNSGSPSNLSHSSPEHSDKEDDYTYNHLICGQGEARDSLQQVESVNCSSPVLTPTHSAEYLENKLVSPIQTPAHYSHKIKTPTYEPDRTDGPWLCPVVVDNCGDRAQSILSPLYDSDKVEPLPFNSDLKSNISIFNSERVASPEQLSDDSSSDHSDKESCKLPLLSSISKTRKSSPSVTSPQNSDCQKFKDRTGSNGPSTSVTDVDGAVQQVSIYTDFTSYNQRSDCLIPLENCGKCLLSPIMTPGRSPVDGGSAKEKSASPIIVPMYSPTDPDGLGSCSATSNEWDRSKENAGPISTAVRRGPRTPPSPHDAVHYDPITPARPDPDEIIFKDSNDNHTKGPSPTVQKKQMPEKRFDKVKGYHKKQPLLPDFKIPRMNNQVRRYPGQESNLWVNRGRGRGNHFFNRVRGRGRWETPPRLYRQRPVPHAYEHDGRRYYHQDDRLSYHAQDRQCYDPALHHQPDGVRQSYDPSVVLQGNAYDAAIMKHAFENMGMPAEYLMRYQQVYVPSFPPPPPLPDEPPPPPPPPPPLPLPPR